MAATALHPPCQTDKHLTFLCWALTEASSLPTAFAVFISRNFSSHFFRPHAQYKAGNTNKACLMKLKKTVFALLHTLTQGILFTLTFLHSLMLRMAE